MSNIEIREGEYGEKTLVVEPGGNEIIPDKDRHGHAKQLFATWMSPNLEFATIFVGALGIGFGLTFAECIIGIVIGNLLGAIGQYFLTQDGPRYGASQMVISRAAFGKLGNILPSGSNAFASGIGWFAVNSVSGALALANLAHMGTLWALIIVAVVQILIAFVGHNLVQRVERFLMPFLVVVFGFAGIVVLTQSKMGGHSGKWSGMLLVFIGATYGYAAGWNPFASDYSRYLPKNTDVKQAGKSAGLGVFVSAAILETVGAAAATAGMNPFSANPTSGFTALLPGWLAQAVLVGIVLGSICANVLNIYSGAMSFVTMGVKLGSGRSRALTALVFGILGFFLAHWAINSPANKLEAFLLTMAYWIGPWLGVIAADKLWRKGASVEGLLFAKRENFAGPVAFIVGAGISIWLFANQTYYMGTVPKNHPGFGDIAFPVGFVLSFLVYSLLGRKQAQRGE